MVARLDVIFTSSKIEEVESAAYTLFEVMSWMDWWSYSTQAEVVVVYLYIVIIPTPQQLEAILGQH